MDAGALLVYSDRDGSRRSRRTPTLFDGVEFNDKIACTDVLYDLAFLLMDLWRRGLPRHANAVWNRCLAETGEFSGLSLFPLFLSCRLMQTLDGAWDAQTSTRSCQYVLRPPCSRAGRPVRHEP